MKLFSYRGKISRYTPTQYHWYFHDENPFPTANFQRNSDVNISIQLSGMYSCLQEWGILTYGFPA